MKRTWVVIAAGLGLLSVALGAFGAHGLAGHFAANPDREPTFETAVSYQMYHALALLGVAVAARHWPGKLTHWAGILMTAGVIIFSGSLYILSILEVRAMGAVAPIGGALMIAGWLCLGLAAWRGADR